MRNKAPYIGDIGIKFPPFDTIVCDRLIEKYFVFDPKKSTLRKEISTGDYCIVMEKYMPENSALFLQDKNIVAIYLDGNLIFDEKKIKDLSIFVAKALKGKMK